MGSMPMRVMVAEDSVLLREGLVRLLEGGGHEVVAQAGDFDDLLRKARAHRPDVAVVDIRMPPTHTDEGIRAAHAIRAEMPDTGVLVLSQYLDDAYAVALLDPGSDGVGYLLKDRVTDVDALLDAIDRVGSGGSAIDPEVVRELLGRRRTEDPLEALTPRERDVLTLMAEGLTNHGIADRLVVTEKAVERHVTSIFSKLLIDAAPNEHRRVLAVLSFLRAA
jgi:DNA-binding NarL/FixJ family response regulator